MWESVDVLLQKAFLSNASVKISSAKIITRDSNWQKFLFKFQLLNRVKEERNILRTINEEEKLTGLVIS
jgi:hypothetical protein